MKKFDFERTPDGSQRILDGHLKVTKTLYIPVFEAEETLNDNVDEPGAIGINQDGVFTYYDGEVWQTVQGLPGGGTTSQYLRGDGTWQTLNTGVVPEGGSNLYYTAGRFNASLATKSTSDLAEGSNLYFTNARVLATPLTGYVSNAGTLASSDTVLQGFNKLNGNIGTKEPTISAGTTAQYWRGDKTWQTLNSDAVPEGSTNLYYTATRFNTAFGAKSTSDLAEGSNLYYTNTRVQTYGDAHYVVLSSANAANGYAKLDAGGLLPLSLIPDTLLGNVKYKGTYDGSTVSSPDSALNGNPLPTAGTGNQGYYFIITTATTISSVNYAVGDWVISDGAAGYTKVENADAVTTVFGRTGNISAVSTDYASFYASLSGSYADPAWITSLAYSKLTGAPTAVSSFTNDSGYITSAALSPYALISGQTFSGAITTPTFGITGTGGAGYISMIAQTSPPSAPAVGSQRIYADASGRFSIMGSNGFAASFSKSALTASRIYLLPDAAGTFALTATTLSGYGITDAYPLSGNPSGFLTGNQVITLSGDVSGSGATSITTTIGAGKVINTMLANSTISGIALGSSLFALSATDGTLSFSASYDGSVARTIGLNLGNANIFTAVQTTKIDGLNSATAVGYSIQNTTAATSGQQQITPFYEMLGKGWATASGGSSQTVGARMYVTPSSGTAPTGIFNIDFNINGTYTNRLTLGSTGNLNIGGRLGTNLGGFGVVSTDAFIFNNTTSSTSGVTVQQTGNLHGSGTVWDTTATASRTFDWIQYGTATSSATPSSAWNWGYQYNSGGYSSLMNLTSGGVLTVSAHAVFGVAGANIWNPSTNVGTNTSTAAMLWGGSSNVMFRVSMTGSGQANPNANVNYSNLIVGSSTVALPSTGTTAWVANVVFSALGTITNTSAIGLTNTTVAYFGAASSAGTNNYSVYSVGSGFFGGVVTTTGLIHAINSSAKVNTYTTLITDEVVQCDTTTTAFAVNLITAVGNAGLSQTIKRINAGANNVTVTPNGAQTIDGASNYVLSAQWKYLTIISNGSNWLITANN